MHVVVLVLGDLGRSPRMQYHALSFADRGCQVTLAGYEGERTVEYVASHPLIREHRICIWDPTALRCVSILHAMLKGASLFLAVLVFLLSLPKCDLVLIQNPPCLPALAAAIIARFVGGGQIMVDWHNLGFSMFQDRLGPTHSLVRIARLLEVKMAAFAQMHVCVSAAMRDWLQEHFDVQATVLYDRPPRLFLKSPICLQQRHDLLLHLGLTDSVFPLLESGANSYERQANATVQTAPGRGAAGSAILLRGVGPTTTAGADGQEGDGREGVGDVLGGRAALLISCTSWTPDEDFNVLLDALLETELLLLQRWGPLTLDGMGGDEPAENGGAGGAVGGRPGGFDRLLVVVTGKGPMQQAFKDRVKALAAEGRLNRRVVVRTAWLAAADYPMLLRCADLGVCVHTSTCGLDLPMKVLDMFGSGVPVCAFRFPALPELVREGENGQHFSCAAELAAHIRRLLVDAAPGGEGYGEAFGELRRLRGGASSIGSWEQNWGDAMWPIVRERFQLQD
jgi:beta-1,4-mannosyltransferase